MDGFDENGQATNTETVKVEIGDANSGDYSEQFKSMTPEEKANFVKTLQVSNMVAELIAGGEKAFEKANQEATRKDARRKLGDIGI